MGRRRDRERKRRDVCFLPPHLTCLPCQEVESKTCRMPANTLSALHCVSHQKQAVQESGEGQLLPFPPGTSPTRCAVAQGSRRLPLGTVTADVSSSQTYSARKILQGFCKKPPRVLESPLLEARIPPTWHRGMASWPEWSPSGCPQ